MYGLPDDAPLHGLVGTELLQVCVGTYELILRLTDQASLMIASTYVVTTAEGETTFELPTDGAPALFPFLGTAVTAAEHSGRGTLRLTFGAAGSLAVPDSWSSYESYTVTVGGTTIVV